MTTCHVIAILGLFTIESAFLGVHTVTSDVQLRGEGDYFSLEVFQTWIAAYRSIRERFQSLHMVYSILEARTNRDLLRAIGNATHGIEYTAMTGSAEEISNIDYKKYPDLRIVPVMAGAVVVGYHMRKVNKLNLSMEHLVGIYNGTITYWDDPVIQALNTGTSLPHARIRTVVREDTSSTTEVFTEALSAVSPEWNATYGTFRVGADEDKNPYVWNRSVVSYYANTGHGMEGIILSVDHSIGYLSASEALRAGITYADLVNRRRNLVPPDVRHITAAMTSTTFDRRFHASLVYVADDDAYPICAYVYMIVNVGTMESCRSAVELYRFIDWLLFDESTKYDTAELNFAPLSLVVAEQVHNRILTRFECGGENVSVLVAEQIRKEELSLQTWRTPVFVSTGIGLVILFLTILYVVYIQIKVNRALFRNEWRIDFSRIIMYSANMTKSTRSGFLDTESNGSGLMIRSRLTVSSSITGSFKSVKIGRYNEHVLILRETKLQAVAKLRVKTRRQFLWMRDTVQHNNVATFHGMTTTENRFWFLLEYCSKGFLHDILQNDRYNLDMNFKFSMSCDVADGMKYLHGIGIVHGNLDSSSCFIDARWTVKIADWGYTKIAELQKDDIIWNRPLVIDQEEDIIARNQLSVAPELLKGAVRLPTKECDVYSFSILLVEIFTREDPFEKELETRTPIQVLNDVKIRGLRPALSTDDFPEALQQLIFSSWDWIPDQRPTFAILYKRLKRMKPSKKGVLDCMMEAVESYAQHLEERVAERTEELNATLKEFETLLHKILPPEIASKLAKGESVEPQSYETVTIFFSDIVGFTALSSASTPMQIVDFLNDLYTNFDTVLDRHDVYKVETIGDAYMVISGLPRCNGILHSGHIATMALEMAITVTSFKIRHRPGMKLQLRAGIHSGPVCAGVVGIKMPRYCLFGDTVNTASRMESTSVALKIQVSEDTYALLEELGGYQLKLRGDVEVKGKGIMKTYWLHGKTGLEGIPPEFTRDVD